MMILMIPAAIVIAVLLGFAIDRLQVGGSGIWYGRDEPPEWFVGFWDKGDVVVQWPRPNTVEDLVTDSISEEALVASGNVVFGNIVARSISADNIRAGTVTDMIPDPDFPGMITTKQELARRREEEK